MLLVIAAAHAPAYLRPPPDLAASTGLDRLVGVASVLMVEGRGYPVFGAMFGYGVVQAARRWPDEEQRMALRLLRRRGLWLILLGSAHAALLWSGDILGAYGVLLLGGTAAMLRCSDRTAAALAAASCAIVGLGGVSMAMARSSESASAGLPLNAVGERLAEWLPTLILQPLGLLGAALIGVVAARRRLLEESGRHRRLLLGIGIGGLTTATLGGIPRALQEIEASPASPVSTAIAGGLHSISGYGGIGYAACAALIASHLGEPGRVTRAIAACGKRSLTSYRTQSVLFTVIMSPSLGRLGERVGLAGAAGTAIAVWGVTVAASELMRRRGVRGPAESLLRTVMRYPKSRSIKAWRPISSRGQGRE